MQNAKDTFYEVVRQRLATLHPERTVVVRGLTRPAVLVAENELVSALTPPDCFLLRWGKANCDPHGAMPAITLTCEISYATAGTEVNGGMDRGRALAAMDAELLAMVRHRPQSAAKRNYAAVDAGGAPVTLATQVWWSDAVLGDVKVVGDRLQRTAAVSVMSFEEGGEL